MKNALLIAAFTGIFAGCGLSFDPITTPAPRAGTIRAREALARKRAHVRALYATTPMPTGESRQVRRARERSGL